MDEAIAGGEATNGNGTGAEAGTGAVCGAGGDITVASEARANGAAFCG